jgi:hypothetical protein
MDTGMPSGAEGKEQRPYCSLYGSAAGGIKSTTIDCSVAGIKEGTGRTAASALDKISEQVIGVLNGQVDMQGRNQFSSRPKIKKTPVHAPRIFPLSLSSEQPISL